MKKYFALALGTMVLLGAGCTGSVATNTQSEKSEVVQENKSEKRALTTMEELNAIKLSVLPGYMRVDATAKGELLRVAQVKKVNGIARMEVFFMTDFNERPFGFEGNETQEDIDGYVPKEQLKATINGREAEVWLFYSANDATSKKELQKMAAEISALNP